MPLSANIRASIYMMLAMAGFVFNDALIKALGGVISVPQIMFIRGVFMCLMLFVILWQQKLLSRWREAVNVLVVTRSIMEAIGTLLFLAALVRLPFANVSAVLQALPLVVAMGAAVFFGEPVGWRRWLAIVIGFGGVLVIIRPGMEGFDSASLLVVATVLVAATRDLLTRRIDPAIPSLLVATATAVILTLMGVVLMLLQESWQPVSARQLLTISAASAFLVVGYLYIVLAMRTGNVAYVVPYRYTSLLWSILLGMVFFAEVPDRYTLTGSLIVVAMGLFTLYREIRYGRRMARDEKRNAIDTGT